MTITTLGTDKYTVSSVKQTAEDAVTEANKKYSAFWAFSKEQFEKKINRELIPYVDVAGGLYVPKVHVNDLIKAYDKASEEKVKSMLENVGKKDLIMYELGNHEACYTYDIADTFDAVEHYGITKDEVQEVFKNDYIPYCHENDLF